MFDISIGTYLSRAILICSSCFLLACQPDEIGPQYEGDNDGVVDDFTNGVFVVNEGNFTWGNGSLSFYNPDEKTIHNRLFDAVNGYPLGDVPQSIRKGVQDYCITVNNSHTVYFCDMDLNVVSSLSGINSPRYSAEDESGNVYISSLYANQIVKVSPDRIQIDTFALFEGWTEEMIWRDDYLYVLQKRFGVEDSLSLNKLYRLNNFGEKTDSLLIGEDTQGMKMISSTKLAVLSSSESSSTFHFVTLGDWSIETKTITGKATLLAFSPSIQKLFYIKDGGVYALNLSDKKEDKLFDLADKNVYGFNIDPIRSEFYITDSKDYVSTGEVYRYTLDGTVLDSVEVSIIPGYIYFENTL